MSLVRTRAQYRNGGVNLRSFETPRRRLAPPSWRARHEQWNLEPIDSWWLVVSVKAECRGCDSVRHADSRQVAPFRLLLLSAEPLDFDSEPVWVASDLVDDLGLRGAPHYAVVSPDGWVVAEGAVFDLEQVLSEISTLVV